MRPRISVITLGVDDLEKALVFYRDGLGLKTEGIIGQEFEYGAVVFFELSGNMRLALWPRDSVAADTGMSKQRPSATDVTIGHNVNTKEEVDHIIAQVEKAGGTIVKAPHTTFWGGYSSYFQDPDGHVWEVTWNPEWHYED